MCMERIKSIWEIYSNELEKQRIVQFESHICSSDNTAPFNNNTNLKLQNDEKKHFSKNAQ